MDEGWTRWMLEQYGFDFIDAPSGGLSQSPLDGESRRARSWPTMRGFRCRRRGAEDGGAARRRRAARVRGSARAEDLQAFEQFVRGGGTLVCLSTASTFAIQQFKLPVTNVVAGLRPEEFFLRGSIVEVVDRSDAPGHGRHARARRRSSSTAVRCSRPQDGFTGTVLARYPETGSPLLSGYLIGEKYLQGKAAALDVPLDAGHVVLLGFRPEWRGQPFGTFRVLFNAALFSR